MENFFKLPQGLGSTITVKSVSSEDSRTLPLSLTEDEQQKILSHFPTEGEDKYLRNRVYLNNVRYPVSFLDIKNGVAHIEVEEEIEIVSLDDITLFPQTEEFVNFVQAAKLCQCLGDGNWGSEHAKDHVETYLVTEDEEVGSVWLLPPSVSCCPIGVDEDDSFAVTSLNDSFSTDSMAYSLLASYAWYKEEA
ncbi:hypothetical protein [Vibrio crassostreae]|uniref:hypothetical protein n=1 Tax=Vibrio crassostreae TaxID=246167 RepID=UPI001B30B83E|nr:hypothetical protein [Vibrio crassostreae]